MNMPKTVLIAIPKGRPFLDGFVSSLLMHFQFEQGRTDYTFNIAIADSQPYNGNEDNPNKYKTIGQLRDKLVQESIKENYDYIWFLDDDMTFSPNTFRALVHHDVPFITSVAHLKKEPFPPNILREEMVRTDTEIHIKYRPITDYPTSKLIKIDACGLACALIKVDALKEIKQPFFEHHAFAEQSLIGEDVVLCRRFFEAGIPIYADTGSKIGHIDTVNGRLITELDFKEFFNK